MLFIERKQQIGNAVAGLAIEVARRFIGKQQRRLAVKSAGQGHALLLAAGKLRGKVVQPLSQPQLLKQGLRLAAPLPVAFAAQERGQLNVLKSVEGGHQHE